MVDLAKQLAVVRSTRAKMKERPIDKHKDEILELIDNHEASLREVVRWLQQYKDIETSASTLCRAVKNWKSKQSP